MTVVHWQRNGRPACAATGAISRNARHITCALCLALYDEALERTEKPDDATHVERHGRPTCADRNQPPRNERLTGVLEFATCAKCIQLVREAAAADRCVLRERVKGLREVVWPPFEKI